MFHIADSLKVSFPFCFVQHTILILFGMLGLYIAFIVTVCGLGVIFLAIPDLMETNLWLVTFSDVITNSVLIWELTCFCHFIEGARHRTMIDMEIATLRI